MSSLESKSKSRSVSSSSSSDAQINENKASERSQKSLPPQQQQQQLKSSTGHRRDEGGDGNDSKDKQHEDDKEDSSETELTVVNGEKDNPKKDSKMGTHLSWKNIKYSVPVLDDNKCPCMKKEEGGEKKIKFKPILRGVTGEVLPGEMCAIIGPSGAGKTSFLNILARRVKATKKKIITGSISIDGKVATQAYFKKISGFVAQEDILMGSMTPWEALRFTATLALGHELTQDGIDKKVTDLLSGMGLLHVKDNFIGFVGTGSHRSGIARGLSGGERKRVSVCVELIHNPHLLFLDEPTSGLDSFAAKIVITCLRQLCDQGRTVICTIHQPSAELLRMFDKLLILGSGSTVYFGPTVSAPAYFKSINHPVPKFCNPADHYLTVVQLGGKTLGEEDLEEGVNLRDAVVEHSYLSDLFEQSEYAKALQNIPDPEQKTVHQKASAAKSLLCGFKTAGAQAPFTVQMRELGIRSLKNVLREPLLFKVRMFQTIFMGILTGLIFLRIPNSITGASNKISGSFFIALNPLMSGINGPTGTFPPERAVFWRENASGLYSAFSYFLAKLLAEFPVNLLAPLIFSTIAWWMMGLNDHGDRFLIFILIEIIVSTLGYAIGLILTLLIYDPAIVQRVQPLILLPLMIFAGFFLNTNSVPVWLIWLERISPVKYAFRACMNVVLGGERYYCSDSDLRKIPFVPQRLNVTLDHFKVQNSTGSTMICPITSGDQFLQQLGMYGFDVWNDILILVAMLLSCLFFSFFLLVCRRPQF